MIAIQPYLHTRNAYGPAFAGNDRLAFLSDITGQHHVWAVDLTAGDPAWPDQLTFGSERALHVSAIPDGTGRLLFSRDVGGNENAQFFLLDPATGAETPLTAGYEAALHLPEIWSRDGQTFFFAANRRHPGLFDLYRQAPSGPADMIWENDRPGYLVSLALSPDGRRLAFNRIFSSFHHDLWELDLAAGAAQRLDDPATTAVYDHLAYAPDGESLFCCTDAGADFRYLARLDRRAGALTPVIQPDWDVEAAALSPDGVTLIYAVNEEGASRLYRLDLATGASAPAPVINDGVGLLNPFGEGGLAFSPDGRRVAFAFMRPTRPFDVYVWDLAADTVRAVTRSSTGGLPADRFAEPDLVHFPTFDARQIPAWYFRPQDTGPEPSPAVVLVHGGPESQFRPMFHFLVQYLGAAGYAVLAPNVRGSTGYGKAYAHLDDVEKRMDSVADLGYAAHWLRARPEIDGDRLAVYGGSYGGFMVLAALTNHAGLWAAGVDIVGISSFVTFLENTSDYRRAHREAEYGSLDRDRDFLERISPINYLAAIDAPLFVIHGANDPRVPLGEAEQIVAALRERDHPVEFLVFPDEGHGVVRLANKEVMYPRVVAFLDRYVRGRST